MTDTKRTETETEPTECDVCQTPFQRGSAYRRMQIVVDMEASRVGEAQRGVPLEGQWDIFSCESCYDGHLGWLFHGLVDQAMLEQQSVGAVLGAALAGTQEESTPISAGPPRNLS